MKLIIIIFTLLLAANAQTKLGTCPNTDGLFGICVERCSTDSACPGDQKCCSNGCGHTCQNPILASKPGACPSSAGLIGTCVEGCSSDASCPADQKCCSNGCGHTCQTPVVLTKPGTCPSTVGMIGTCINACVDDSSCSGTQKCCSNGCGKTCQEPAKIVKSGVCPYDNSTSVGICVEECSGDSSCPLLQKCCSNGCGHSCKSPVFPCLTEVKCKTGETCKEVNGSWACLPCPLADCLVDPCMGKTCPGFPTATCKPDYCGGCYTKWDINGTPVTCGPPAPACNCSNVPLIKSAIACADGSVPKFSCDPATCAWKLQPCPPTDAACTTCNPVTTRCYAGTSGTLSVSSSEVIASSNSTACGKTLCQNVNGVCFGYLSCDDCPRPAPKCVVSGCKMENCLLSSEMITQVCPLDLNPTPSCTRFSSCIYNETSNTCGWLNTEAYKNCLNNATVVDPCRSLDPCVCGSNPKCGFCQANITLASGPVIPFGICIQADLAGPKCLAPKASLGLAGQFLPSIICPEKLSGSQTQGEAISERAKGVAASNVQPLLNHLVKNDPSLASKFSISLDSIIDARPLSSTQITLRNIVTVFGNAAPTAEEEKSLCNALADALVRNVGGSIISTDCKLSKLSQADQSLLKRTASQSTTSNSYVADVNMASDEGTSSSVSSYTFGIGVLIAGVLLASM